MRIPCQVAAVGVIKATGRGISITRFCCFVFRTDVCPLPLRTLARVGGAIYHPIGTGRAGVVASSIGRSART